MSKFEDWSKKKEFGESIFSILLALPPSPPPPTVLDRSSDFGWMDTKPVINWQTSNPQINNQPSCRLWTTYSNHLLFADRGRLSSKYLSILTQTWGALPAPKKTYENRINCVALILRRMTQCIFSKSWTSVVRFNKWRGELILKRVEKLGEHVLLEACKLEVELQSRSRWCY